MARMTVEELTGKIVNALENSGLTRKESNHSVGFYADTKYHTEPYYHVFAGETVTLTHHFGDTIEVREVYRSNGTDENQSVDICIFNWFETSGKRTFKVRCNTNMGDKAIANKVRQAVEQYNA